MPLFTANHNDLAEHGEMPFYQTFQIGSNGDGGEDTYYPVRYNRKNAESQGRIDYVQVYRRYNETGPSVHGTHKAGLSTYWHGTDGAWDGGATLWYCDEFYQTYRRTLAAAEIWSGSNNDVFFHLRGGGYFYRIRSSCDFDITIYYSKTLIYRYPPRGDEWYAIPRILGDISSVASTGTTFGSNYSAGELSGTRRTT